MKDAASSNVIPMALDEFKPSKIDKYRLDALLNHFRNSYDGQEGIRGRADQSIVSYELLARLWSPVRNRQMKLQSGSVASSFCFPRKT